MFCVNQILSLVVLVPAVAALDSTEACKVFPNTNFAGHDLIEADENTVADCCSACQAKVRCSSPFCYPNHNVGEQ